MTLSAQVIVTAIVCFAAGLAIGIRSARSLLIIRDREIQGLYHDIDRLKE